MSKKQQNYILYMKYKMNLSYLIEESDTEEVNTQTTRSGLRLVSSMLSCRRDGGDTEKYELVKKHVYTLNKIIQLIRILKLPKELRIKEFIPSFIQNNTTMMNSNAHGFYVEFNDILERVLPINGWLSTSTISSYYHMLNSHADFMEKKCCFFPVHYLESISNTVNYHELFTRYHIKRLERPKYTLFFPVHMGGNHWILIVVRFTDFTITVYDSLGSRNSTHALKHYEKESLKRLISIILLSATDKKPFTFLRGDCYQQDDASACGIYTVYNARYLAEDVRKVGETFEYQRSSKHNDLQFRNIEKLRDLLALELLTKNLK